jgi:hypothetical protein
MQVLVQIRGSLDPLRDLWPYAPGVRSLPSGSSLTLDVHDSRELVGALLAIADLGVEITAVDIPLRASGG